MSRIALTAVAICLCGFSTNLATNLATAQDSALAELYGRGVHAYFSNYFDEAHEYLSQAIEEGTDDPRAYFFRGLTYAMTGRPDEAAADFKKGAELEAMAIEKVYDVSRALQRVQGDLRLQIEEQRHEARLAARELAARRARARYQQFQRSQEEAVLNPDARRGAPDTRPPATGAGAPVVDPFGEAEPTTPPPATEPMPDTDEPPPETTPEAEDPFGSEEATPTPTPNADPFGGDEPTTPPSTDTDATETNDDPFGAAPRLPDNSGEPATAAPPTTDNAGSAGAGTARRGALGGLFRAFRNSVPTPELPAGLPGLPGGLPFGGGSDEMPADEGEVVDPFGNPNAAPDEDATPDEATPEEATPDESEDSDDGEAAADPF